MQSQLFSTRIFSILLLACALAGSAFGQVTVGRWDEVFGKRVVNLDGVTLGYVHDTVLDLENGRYVGLLVTHGGFFGWGTAKKVVPALAFLREGPRNTLLLDISKDRFLAAPTLKLSQKVGPPNPRKLAEIYRYYGQEPYFATEIQPRRDSNGGRPPLGFVNRGSRILLLPVDNLQGKYIGYVNGLRDLQLNTGYFTGVVIKPVNFFNDRMQKIVQPQALRYNSEHNRLRLNDHDKPFIRTADIAIDATGVFVEEPPSRHGNPPPPLAQGYRPRDKQITAAIWDSIRADSSLSHYAKTIEVGTIKGNTTLRGRVTSAAGRNQILAYARAAGARNITDLITIRPESPREAAIDSH